MRHYTAMAVRNVLRNSRRSLFVGATVAIGAFALMVFVGYMAATASAIREVTIRGGVGHFQIGHPGQFDGAGERPLQFGLEPADRQKIDALTAQDPRIRRVVPRLGFGGLISNGDQTLTFQGNGVQPDLEQQTFGAFQNIETGRRLSAKPDDRYSVLLGKELARRLGVALGDGVTVLTSTAHGAINAIDLTVVGLIATGVPESELYLVQMPIATAQELLRTDKIGLLSVLLEKTDDTDAAIADFARAEPGFEVRSWRQLNPLFDQIVALYRNQFIVFGVIIAIVVFLSVGSMTLTSIMERSREIGTLRAIGISGAKVQRIFMIEGIIMGGMGVVMSGILTAFVIFVVNESAIQLPPPPGRNVGVLLHLSWSPESFLAIMSAMVVLCGFSAWLISRRVARMKILTALSSL